MNPELKKYIDRMVYSTNKDIVNYSSVSSIAKALGEGQNKIMFDRNIDRVIFKSDKTTIANSITLDMYHRNFYNVNKVYFNDTSTFSGLITSHDSEQPSDNTAYSSLAMDNKYGDPDSKYAKIDHTHQEYEDKIKDLQNQINELLNLIKQLHGMDLNYYTKPEVDEFINKLENKINDILILIKRLHMNLDDYYTAEQVNAKLTEAINNLHIEDYQLKNDLTVLLTKYAMKTDLPDVSNFITEADVDTKITGFVKEGTQPTFQNVKANNFMLYASADNSTQGLYFQCGKSDRGAIRCSQKTINEGFLELCTGDDGTEPIYVKQYKGGNDIWNFDTVIHSATLLDTNGKTTFPVEITCPKITADNLYTKTEIDSKIDVSRDFVVESGVNIYPVSYDAPVYTQIDNQTGRCSIVFHGFGRFSVSRRVHIMRIVFDVDGDRLSETVNADIYAENNSLSYVLTPDNAGAKLVIDLADVLTISYSDLALNITVLNVSYSKGNLSYVIKPVKNYYTKEEIDALIKK